MIVHTSIGGRRIRVNLSNAQGKPLVQIGSAHLAIHKADGSIVPETGPPTDRRLGLHTAYISKGNVASQEIMPEPTTTFAYLWLASIDVLAPANAFTIVALGDSITDGFATTLDANRA